MVRKLRLGMFSLVFHQVVSILMDFLLLEGQNYKLFCSSGSFMQYKVLDIIGKGGVKGIAHITGGGFSDNIPRIFPAGLGAKIFSNSWEIPAVFKWLQEAGGIEDAEMRRTFNMGVGMALVVTPEASQRILTESKPDDPAYLIGEVVNGGVHFQ